MNTFQLKLIKKSLGDSEKFAQNLRGALELSQDSFVSKGRVLNLFRDLDSVEEPAQAADGFRDFSFSYLLIRNFRKYDKPNGGDSFCLTFGDGVPALNPKKQFHVFLGDNGSGKSSLFDAMEYVCTGKVSEAVYRKINQEWFLQRLEGSSPQQIKVKTPQTVISTDSDTFFSENIDVNRFFFSENSIMESGDFKQAFNQTKNETSPNWYDFFLYAIGLDRDFVEFISDRPTVPLFSDVCNFLQHLKDILTIDGSHAQKLLKELLVDKATTLMKEQKSNLEIFRNNIDDFQVKWEQGMYEGKPQEELVSSLFEFYGKLDKSNMQVSAVSDFAKQLHDIERRIPRNPEDVNLGAFAKQTSKLNVEEERKTTIRKLREELFNMLSEYKSRFNTILENDDAHFDLSNVIKKDKDIKAWKYIQSHAHIAELSVESIDNLLSQLDEIRKNARKEIKNVVKEIINDEFRALISNMFEGVFLKAKENFNFDISNIDNEEIKISVNDIPVHKYFNTFRYRLFYLSIQAAINLAKMKREHFAFPMVLDDIFYANDYKNKRQLFRFFNLLEKEAERMLPNQSFQVIFFTHDEQLVSTLNRKKQKSDSTSCKFSRIIEYEDFQNVQMYESLDENSKCFKINLPIYE